MVHVADGPITGTAAIAASLPVTFARPLVDRWALHTLFLAHVHYVCLQISFVFRLRLCFLIFSFFFQVVSGYLRKCRCVPPSHLGRFSISWHQFSLVQTNSLKGNHREMKRSFPLLFCRPGKTLANNSQLTVDHRYLLTCTHWVVELYPHTRRSRSASTPSLLYPFRPFSKISRAGPGERTCSFSAISPAMLPQTR